MIYYTITISTIVISALTIKFIHLFLVIAIIGIGDLTP